MGEAGTLTSEEANLYCDVLESVHGIGYMVWPCPAGGFMCIPHPPSRENRKPLPRLIEV